jgi:hypothetical protein
MTMARDGTILLRRYFLHLARAWVEAAEETMAVKS